MKKRLFDYIERHKDALARLHDACADDVEVLANKLLESIRAGKKLVVFGNGGSAADAQHMAAELVGTFMNKKRGPLPAVALSTNTSSVTSISNDFDFESVFERQLLGLVQPGDVCLGISTSGNSPNVKRALVAAREKGAFAAALLGKNGGSIKDVADLSIIIPSDLTPVIQEMHILIIHVVCWHIDDAFCETSEI